MVHRYILRHLTVLVFAFITAAAGWAAEPLVRSGDSIAFLGDSITQFGADQPSGYVRLVISGLEANGIKTTAVPAGVSGHKSNQMLERLQRDVIAKKPTWMTLSCGVNDVWHGSKGVPLDQYKTNITAIVDQATAAGIKVMVLTATMIHEDAGNENNKALATYNAFLRQLATERKLPLADLNADMQAGIEAVGKHGDVFTVDGVHMNPFGNRMMAVGVLRALGLDKTQIAKADAAWLDIPKAVSVWTKLTLRQYAQLNTLATKQGKPLADLANDLLAKAIADAAGQPAGK